MSPAFTAVPLAGFELFVTAMTGSVSGCVVVQVVQLGGVPPGGVPPVATTTLPTLPVAVALTVTV